MDLQLLSENPEIAKNLRIELSPDDLIKFGQYVATRTIAGMAKKENPEETYMTTEEYATALNVTKTTLHNWDKAGITRPLKIGARKLYRRSDLEKILKEKKAV